MTPFLLNAQASFRLGLRTHALRALLALGLVLIGVAFLAGAFSLRQPLVVSLDVGISGLRFLGVLLVLFWMQEAFVKDIERRTITLALAYPVRRSAYVVGRFAGVMLLIIIAVAIWAGLLYLMGKYASWGYADSSRPVFGTGYLLVLVGVCLDLLVLGSVVLFLISASTSSLLPFLAGGAFALAARSVGPVLDYLVLSADADPGLKQGLLPLLAKIRWLIPDLSRLDWREIVLYGSAPVATDILSGILIAVGYFLMMVWLAVWMYGRREIA